MPDRLTLGFDTAAAHCAAALLCGDKVLAEAHEIMAKGQAERLMGLLEDVLAAGGAGWKDLARIGVGIGPGNFTGIRISVAAARGLALSLGIPAHGVSTHEALALGQDVPCVTSVDARGGRLYVAAQGVHQLCTVDTLPALPAGPVIGAGAAEIAQRTGGRAEQPRFALAPAIARIAAARPPTTERPAPLYLRPPDAAPPRDPAPVLLP